MIFPLTRAHLTALIAFILFVVSILVDIRLAPVPLALFIAVCVAASFFPRLGYYLPIVSRGKKDGNGVALTFDDGPDPRVTPLLLDLLERQKVTATFFVTGAEAERHPELVKEILSRGHAVGNHSFAHSPWLMLKGKEELRRELEGVQDLFKGLGIVPLAFRPPYGITGPRLWRVLLELGLFCVGSGRRGPAKSGGIVGTARRLLRKVAPGEILTLPDTVPEQGVELFLKEVAMLVDGIHGKGLEIVPLGRLIGRETMLRPESGCGTRPVELFYNDLAPAYDLEQFSTAVSMSKRKEYELFLARLPALCTGTERVLEIGAGTGIFTIPLARRCREVVAVDISRNMLAHLKEKAAGEGLSNIRTLLCDAETIPLDGTFSLICAFASLEYMCDLPALVQRLSRHLEPGGTIYFITARRSFLRFFIQLGNAMRQGVWLKARGGREVQVMLRDAGFAQVEVSTHLFKVWRWGGMLLEVAGRRPGLREAAAQAAVAPGPPASLRTLLLLPLRRSGEPQRPLVENVAAQGLPALLVEGGGDDGGAAAGGLPAERLRLGPEAGERDALWAAAALAKEKGYGALLTLGTGGRFEPADVRLLLDAARGSWPAIVIGAGRSAPGGRGRGLSGFLVGLECGQSVPDPGSGLRLYPVDFLISARFLSRRRGLEIETLVRGAWAGLPLVSVPLSAPHPPSAGRDGAAGVTDILSLVFLHGWLLTRSILPWPHRRMVPKSGAVDYLLLVKKPLQFFRVLCREHASAAELAAAAWVGIFIGALPIIPFGLVTIAYVNHKLHLNKLAGMAASNVCVFPFVPFLCVEVGYFFRFGRFWNEFNRQTLVHEIHYRLWEWLLGSLVIGPIIGLAGALLTYLVVRHLRRGAPLSR